MFTRGASALGDSWSGVRPSFGSHGRSDREEADHRDALHGPSWALGFQDNLDAAVLLVTEHAIGGRPLAQRESMRDQERGVDGSARNLLEEHSVIARHMCLARLQG